ncbi:LytTR family DNA-binding domain-containing protein [Gangjinia marincola]|uniref:LytR/AlgR family response regulator transcription factor n=1 Tax=Gangjinia marincola TaxID=578463 RepID=UPI0031E248E2
MKLKCAVVDDSGLQRLAMVKLIKDHPNLELVAQYGNAIETKKGLANTRVDLIFLDIEMPILTGFDLLDGLPNKPEVIFVAGKTQYAFKAFDYEPVDYLSKPVDKSRFELAIQKAIAAFVLKNKNLYENDDNYIFIKSNQKKHKVYLNNIRYVEALGDYVKFVTDEDSYVVLSTMKAYEKELPQDQFMRIHKSFLINLHRVEGYNSKYAMVSGTDIPISRHKKKNMVEALEELKKD